MPALDYDTQQHTAEIYQQVIQSKLVTDYNDISHIYSTTLLMLDSDAPHSHTNTSNKSASVIDTSIPTQHQQSWLNTLHTILPLLHHNDYLSLCQYSVTKGDVTCSIISRYTCVIIWSHLSAVLQPNDIYAQIFHHAIQTCQDTDYSIRHVMCQHLISIIKPLLTDTTNNELFCTVSTTVINELHELLRDENIDVRYVAFTTLIELIDYVSAEQRSTDIYPIVKQHYIQSHNNTSVTVQHTLAQNIGYVMFKLQHELTLDPSTYQRILALYKQYCTSDDITVRKYCVYHIPCIVSLLGSARFIEHLPHIFNKLTRDPCVDVRRVIALSLLDIVNLLGNRSYKYSKDILLTLLRDNSTDIIHVVINQLNSIITAYHTLTNDSITLIIHDIVKSMIAYDTAIQWKYTYKIKLLQVIQQWPKLLSDDINILYERIIPLIQSNMHNSVQCTNSVLCHTYCVYIKNQLYSAKRNEYITWCLRSLSQSKSYKHRELFIEFTIVSLHYFSYKWFRKYLFTSLMTMSTDCITSIRLLLSQHIPLYYTTLLTSCDQQLIDTFHNTCTVLHNDTSHYVRTSMHLSQCAVDRMVLNNTVDSRQQQCESDEEQLIRAEEESLQNSKQLNKAIVNQSRKHMNVTPRIDTGLNNINNATDQRSKSPQPQSKSIKLTVPSSRSKSVSTPNTPSNTTLHTLKRHDSNISDTTDEITALKVDDNKSSTNTYNNTNTTSTTSNELHATSKSDTTRVPSWQRHFKSTQLNLNGKILAHSTFDNRLILPKIDTVRTNNNNKLKHIDLLSSSSYAQLSNLTRLGPRRIA